MDTGFRLELVRDGVYNSSQSKHWCIKYDTGIEDTTPAAARNPDIAVRVKDSLNMPNAERSGYCT